MPWLNTLTLTSLLLITAIGCGDELSEEPSVVEPSLDGNGFQDQYSPDTTAPREDIDQMVRVQADTMPDRGEVHDDSGMPPDMTLRTDADAAMHDELACEPDPIACAEISAYWNGSASRYPIVLVHGFMGWDRRWWLDYFFDIPQTLHESGYSVFVAAMDPVASSEVRSEQLSIFLDAVLACSCKEKINLIGHSQGGLDARMIIGPHNRKQDVASITTISSPHLGFQLADDVLAAQGLGPAFLNALTTLTSTLFLGPAENENDLRATLHAMSIETRNAYNQRFPDPPEVPIYSYAGFTGPLSNGGAVCSSGRFESPERGDLVEPALLVLYGLLGGAQQPNDGVVPVDACVWGEFLGCIAADHWDQIGQAAGLSDQFDFRAFYRTHAAFLSEQGF